MLSIKPGAHVDTAFQHIPYVSKQRNQTSKHMMGLLCTPGFKCMLGRGIKVGK